MRLLVLIALFFALQALPAREQTSARQRMAVLFKTEFRFDAGAAEMERERRAHVPDEDVVVMAPVHVRDKARENATLLEEKLLHLDQEKFNWRDGGTIATFDKLPLRPELKFKYNPVHNGIDILNFSW